MTDPLSPGTPSTGEEPELPEVPPLTARRRRAARLRAWADGRERRLAAGVVTVALLGAGGLAVAAAAHEGHGEGGRGHREAAARSEDGHGYGHADGSRRTDGPGREQGHGHDRQHGHGQGHGVAPAALPSLGASAALEKAQAAVPGGRAESLRRVTEQGGGAAWAVTVVGRDGVRHLVTVDGTSGELTSNTTDPGRASAGASAGSDTSDGSEG
ncbi:PepSY domain-containing protein [Kitasatospora sp. NPDC127059]|uniref:PepSY domain-containing protein n=1 Tax=unclassified Kitasatospora TaxID=2633591 RepID=UPI003659F829